MQELDSEELPGEGRRGKSILGDRAPFSEQYMHVFPHSLRCSPNCPGGGEFPCVHCSRHFISRPALEVHLKTKVHKRRLKELKDKPYSQEEADAAAGLGRETRRRASGSGGDGSKGERSGSSEKAGQTAVEAMELEEEERAAQ